MTSFQIIMVAVGGVVLLGGAIGGLVLPRLSQRKTPDLEGLQSPKEFAALSKDLVTAYEDLHKQGVADRKEIRRLKEGTLAVLQVQQGDAK